MRRLQAAEEDNSTDIALVVVLCTMVVLLLIGSAFVMQGESDFFSSNQQGNRHNNRRRRARSRRQQQVNPTVVDLSFSLNDLYTGTKRAFKVQRQVVCPSLRTGDAPSRAHCETAVELCRHRQVKTQAQRDGQGGTSVL